MLTHQKSNLISFTNVEKYQDIIPSSNLISLNAKTFKTQIETNLYCNKN